MPNRLEDGDQHGLEVSQVAEQVLPVGAEVENRIPDELTGTVVRHVSTPPYFEELEAESVSEGGVGQHVLGRRSRSQRDHVRVLEEKEVVGHFADPPTHYQIGLDFQGLPVGHEAEIPHLQLDRVTRVWAIRHRRSARDRGMADRPTRSEAEHYASSGKSSRSALSPERNLAASAPSTSR